MVRTSIYVSILAGFVLTVCWITAVPRTCVAQSGANSSENFTQEEWMVFRQDHEPLLEMALKAYNRQDYQGFIKNFSSRRRKMSERAFRALWVHGYKAEYGDYVSKQFLLERSDPIRRYPLLAYKAEFSENAETGIRCIFAEDEDGEYRIFYLRIDPYEDLFY
jgi:hypothetical protein